MRSFIASLLTDLLGVLTALHEIRSELEAIVDLLEHINLEQNLPRMRFHVDTAEPK